MRVTVAPTYKHNGAGALTKRGKPLKAEVSTDRALKTKAQEAQYSDPDLLRLREFSWQKEAPDGQEAQSA